MQLNGEVSRGGFSEKEKTGICLTNWMREAGLQFTSGQAQASDSVSHEGEKSVRCHCGVCVGMCGGRL